MKPVVVKLSGMPFDPTHEIDDDTIAIGNLVRPPGSDPAFVKGGRDRIVVSLEIPYTGTCNRVTRST